VPEPFSDNPRHVLEDVFEAFIQMRQNPLIICAVTGKYLGDYTAVTLLLRYFYSNLSHCHLSIGVLCLH
jgi:hypothetical protein